jgi:hypothetical protein
MSSCKQGWRWSFQTHSAPPCQHVQHGCSYSSSRLLWGRRQTVLFCCKQYRTWVLLGL